MVDSKPLLIITLIAQVMVDSKPLLHLNVTMMTCIGNTFKTPTLTRIASILSNILVSL